MAYMSFTELVDSVFRGLGTRVEDGGKENKMSWLSAFYVHRKVANRLVPSLGVTGTISMRKS